MCKTFPTDNKNVRMDERGRECYFHPTRQKWLPGHKEKRCFVWDFAVERFYDRPRPYEMPDGSTKRVRKTRYTYEFFHRYDKAPVGKHGKPYAKALKTYRREVLWDGERFWRAANVLMENGEWFDHTLEPFNGMAFDAFPEQSEEQGIPVLKIWCIDGVPTEVEMDGEKFEVGPDEWQSMYAQVLCLRAA